MEAIEVISWLLMLMLLLRFCVVMVNWVWIMQLPLDNKMLPAITFPLVSILIPARNEALNLPYLLDDIKKLDYPNIEIIVCNDHSTDSTKEVLKSYSANWKALSYFDSVDLPEKWMGKNFGCYQLAKKASGNWFLFIDADVRLKSNSISRAVSYAKNKRLALLSIFPQQLMFTRGERLTVPVMNWILLSMLPLIAVRLPWFSSLSAANGQFMMFEAEAYKKNQWHRQVWNKNVDDIIIARKMKSQKQSIAVLTGNDDVLCRMYSSKDEAINGFARNIHHFFGGMRSWMILFVIVAWVRLPYFLVMGQWYFFSLSLFLLIIMKTGVAIVSKQPVYNALYLHFHHLCNMTSMAFANISNKKQIIWKGRVYNNAI